MVESLTALLTALNALTPIGLAGLLGLVIWSMVKVKRQETAVNLQLDSIANNHLSGMPEILDTLHSIQITLERLDAYLRARLNGGPRG